MKKILIWGIGKICKMFCKHLKPTVQIMGFVETMPHAAYFNSYPVYQPSEITRQDYEILIVAMKYPDVTIEHLIKELHINRDTVIFLYPQNLKRPKRYMLNIGMLDELVETAYFTELLNEQLKSVLCDAEFLGMYYRKIKLQEKSAGLSHTKGKKILQKINLPYVSQYLERNYEIQKDTECNMYYIKDCEERIYFPEAWPPKKVICYYRDCCIDAHRQSPLHVNVNGYNITYVEMGVKEGMTLLRNIERIGKAYILCQKEEWIPALLKTFEKYQYKVSIIDRVEAIPDRKLDIVYINTEDKIEPYISYFIKNKEVGRYEVVVYYSPDMAQYIEGIFSDYGYKSLDKGEVYNPYPLNHMEDLLPRKGLLTASLNDEDILQQREG